MPVVARALATTGFFYYAVHMGFHSGKNNRTFEYESDDEILCVCQRHLS